MGCQDADGECFQAIIRNLVRRYVTQEQRKAENEGVTEDDVNEIKNDISAFRFEMIEIMRASGMNTQSASGPAGGVGQQQFLLSSHSSVSSVCHHSTSSGPGGKKNRQKERRLMKGFNLSTGAAPGAAGAAGTENNLQIKFAGNPLFSQ